LPGRPPDDELARGPEREGRTLAAERMLLQPEDLAILAIECPTVVGHTCKVVRLAPGGLEVDAVRERLAERLPSVPVLLRRLGGSDEAPEWVEDPGFELERHVGPVATQAPLDETGLRGAVAAAFAEHLDRDRPLWRIDVAPLADGGTALLWRVHHALADGTTLMRWAEALLWDADAHPPVATTTAVAKTTPSAHADERRRRRELAAFVAREYALSRHRSPFDGVIGTRRDVGLTTLSLGELRTAGHELAGATVNDTLLTVLTGALRGYMQTRHGRVSDIRVRIPVSLHHEGDAVANHDSFFTLALPVHVADPVERLHVIKRATATRKGARDAEHSDALLRRLDPVAPLQQLVSRVNDDPRAFAVSVSNVPGPRRAVAVAGVPVTALAGLAEIGRRHALRVSAVSLGDVFSLGFCSDPELVPDVQTMADAAAADAATLTAAAGQVR
jgi:diacylglycerol O-acyltransferase / wax synthase